MSVRSQTILIEVLPLIKTNNLFIEHFRIANVKSNQKKDLKKNTFIAT